MFPGVGKAIFLASGAGPPLLSATAIRLVLFDSYRSFLQISAEQA